jgi:hypothetical protein
MELFTRASRGSPKYDIPDLGITTHPYQRLPHLLHLYLIHVDDAAALDLYHTFNGTQIRHLQEMGQKWYVEASKAGAFERSTRRLSEELGHRIGQWEHLYAQEAPVGERERCFMTYV